MKDAASGREVAVVLHLSIGLPLDPGLIDGVECETGVELAFYGAPRGFVLDGGRVPDDSWEKYVEVLDHLAKRETAFNLCCNTALGSDEVHFDDRALATLAAAHRPGNGVIVARHWVAREIRQRFPQFRVVFSSIGALTESWDEDRLFAEYDVVVCPADRTNDFSLVKRSRHWSQVEVFLNNECVDFGPRCLGHYRHTSLTNAGRPPRNEFCCPNLRGGAIVGVPLQPSQGDLRRYLSLGVRRFKVIERTARGQDFQAHFHRLRAAATPETEPS